MTTELVTGKQGRPHIDGDDVGSLTAAIAGHGDYLLQRADGTWPAITMQDANHALIPTLNLLVEGRYARVTAAESVVIESGQSGQKRNDLVCLKYTRDSNQIESVAWTVIKGTPTAGTPADPTVPAGSILGGSATAYALLARIPIDGLTPGTPVMLAGRLHPIADMQDSATLYNSGGWIVSRRGRLICIRFQGSIAGGAWDSGVCPYTLPAGYRPPFEVNAACTVHNGQTSRMLIVAPDGVIHVANMGAAGSTQTCVGFLVYPIG